MFPGPIFIIETEVTQRNRFSKEEDEQLKALVGQYDEPDWKKIASCLKSRSPRQCRERYNNYLRPDLINGPWSPEEEDLLIEKYEKYGPKWSTIVKYFPSRSSVNIKNHHSSLVSHKCMKERSKRMKTIKSSYKTVQYSNDDFFDSIHEKNDLQDDEFIENLFSEMNLEDDDLWSNTPNHEIFWL